jgi:5-methylcytosine-specific restriction endonuclease McrA
MSKRRSSPEFLKRRTELLQGNPLCHWCNKAPATEADHLIPFAIVGDDTELVASCKSCNSRRGAEFINGQRTAQAHARAEHLGLDPTTKPKAKQNNPELFLKKEKIKTDRKSVV